MNRHRSGLELDCQLRESCALSRRHVPLSGRDGRSFEGLLVVRMVRAPLAELASMGSRLAAKRSSIGPAVAFGITVTLHGCSWSQQSCGQTGCLPAIAFTTRVAGAGNGKYTAVFCKASTCETAELNLPSIAFMLVEGEFNLDVGAQATDAGVELTVTVLSAPSFDDGERLSFILSDAAGTKLIDWSTVAKYSVRNVGGPGCGSCARLASPLPE